MVKIKICGIKREEDVRLINMYLPDYAGFVFAESRRRVTIKQALNLCRRLDKRIRRVGVFVNEPEDVIIEAVKDLSLDVVQLSGDENPDYVRSLDERIKKTRSWEKGSVEKRIEIWKAIRVVDKSSLDKMRIYDVDKYLLDSYTKGSFGGSGTTFNWDLIKEELKILNSCKNIIIAGGLNSENVKEAIKILNPYGVDVSSGVETGGVKDEGKIRDFINCVRGVCETV